jgi:hypothetical protein
MKDAAMRSAAGLMLVLFGLLLVAGCGGSTAATLQSGRMVDASSDTFSMSQSNQSDTAILQLGAVEVTVEPARVLVEQKVVAKLAPESKRVSVTRAKGNIKVVADGTTVYDAPLR